MVVREVDKETMSRARNIFNDYKNRGVILNNSFDDPLWKLSNQVRAVSLTMISFEGTFHKNAKGWIGCSYRCFSDSVRAYIALNFGKIGLHTLQDISKALNSIAGMTTEEAAACTENLNHVTDFLHIIPGGSLERDYVIDSLEERLEQTTWVRGKGAQRQLADFKAYLRFHDVLTQYWLSADEKHKLFYFPLYMWWNLTAVLPLRPMEFLLIPRDCFHSHDGVHTITIRRTKLKGSAPQIGYRIDTDYDLKQYSIHDSLAGELRWYLAATSTMPDTEINTLFLNTPYNLFMGKPAGRKGRYFTYSNMNTCLNRFFDDVINAGGHDVSPINLGDTRHIAMTNLIISGGSPVICRELAGHAGIDISSHYYSNISNLVECVTYEKWRKAKGNEADFSGRAKYAVTLPKNAHRVAGGYCDSPTIKDGNIDDCMKSYSGKGHIGECAFCGHYWPDDQGVRFAFYDTKAGKEQVDADSRHLIRMIELVRKGIGHTEDIGAALLRLQNSSNHYGKCLLEKYMEVGKWQGQEK
jgi:hypothetical protein